MHLRLPEDGELGARVWVSAFVQALTYGFVYTIKPSSLHDFGTFNYA